MAGQTLDYNTFKEQIDNEEGEAIGFYLPTQEKVQEGGGWMAEQVEMCWEQEELRMCVHMLYMHLCAYVYICMF